MGLSIGLVVSGTVMPREGQSPLFAVSSMLDGHVVQAAVIDPQDSPDLLADLLAPSVQSSEQPRP